MKTKIKILWLAITAFLACNETPTRPQIDYESEVNVFGRFILYANKGQLVSQKNITLEHTYKITERFPDPRARAIEDARVIVRSDEQQVEFQRLFEGTYGDVEDKLKLKPGAAYQLEVLLQDGRRVTAETIIPTLPEIIIPERDAEVSSFQPLTIKWRPALFCDHYAVTVYAVDGNFNVTLFSDKTEENFYPFLFAFPGRYMVKIAALDQNLYDYLRSRSNRNPILHINGGIGVFGSMAFTGVPFMAGLN